jgi:YD repeat-containing protein
VTKMSKHQANSRGKTKRAGRGSKAAMMWSLLLLVLAVGALELVNQFNLSSALTRGAMTKAGDGGDRGTVVVNTEGGRCERMKYDEAGHVIEQFKPCTNSDLELDEHGRPLPTGTMRRLDAIGNSFLGRQ